MARDWAVPKEWSGETVFILAGGPSLAGMDVSNLPGRIIAINNSWLLRPDADILYFCDSSWWKRHGEAVKDGFRGRIVSLSDALPGGEYAIVNQLRCGGRTGLDVRPGFLRHGANSGYQAINLAVHFGAKRIILLGYDMKTTDGKSHWHAGHGRMIEEVQHSLEKRMLPQFRALVDPLKELGVEVINATPGSALKCFPMWALDQIA